MKKQKGTKKRTYLRSISYTEVNTGNKHGTATQLYQIGLYLAYSVNGKHNGQGSRQNPPTTSETDKAIERLEKAQREGLIKDLHYTTQTAWQVDGLWEKYVEPFEVPSDYTHDLNVHFHVGVKPLKGKYVFTKFGYQFFVNNTGADKFGICEWSTGANICQYNTTEEEAILKAKKKLDKEGKKAFIRGVNYFKTHAATKINKPYEKVI